MYREIWIEETDNGLYYEGTINDSFFEGYAPAGTTIEDLKAKIDTWHN